MTFQYFILIVLPLVILNVGSGLGGGQPGLGGGRPGGGIMPGSPIPVNASDPRYQAALNTANQYLTSKNILTAACPPNSLTPTATQQLVNGMNYFITFTIPATCSATNAAKTCTITVYVAFPTTTIPNPTPVISNASC